MAPKLRANPPAPRVLLAVPDIRPQVTRRAAPQQQQQAPQQIEYEEQPPDDPQPAPSTLPRGTAPLSLAALTHFINTGIPDQSEATLDKMVQDLKRVFGIGKCKDLGVCLRKPGNAFAYEIENAINPRNGERYASGTITGNYSTLLTIYDKGAPGFASTVTEDQIRIYREKYAEYFAKVAGESRAKQTAPDHGVYRFPALVSLAGDRFGQDSKEYLFLNIYGQVPLRDDFNSIKLVPHGTLGASDENYVVMPPPGNAKNYIAHIVMNRFHKTQGVTNPKTLQSRMKKQVNYGIPDEMLTARTSSLIAAYIKKHGLVAGESLFGKGTSSSQFVRKLLAEVGVVGKGQNLNYLRHSMASTVHERNNPDEIAKLARKMKHDINQSYGYKRVLLDVSAETAAAAKRGPPAKKPSNRGRPKST